MGEMRKKAFVMGIISIMLVCGISISACKGKAESAVAEAPVTSGLEGAVYLHADSGLRFDFFDVDMLDVFAGPDTTPLTCGYTFDSGIKKGEIIIPGNDKLGDFSLNASGGVMTFTQTGQKTGIPMRKQ
jgi:hypothetical protein